VNDDELSDLVHRALAAPPGKLEFTHQPRIGPTEAFVHHAVSAIPLGNMVTDSLVAALLRAGSSGGERAVLTPQARFELRQMGEIPAQENSFFDTYRQARDTRRRDFSAGANQNPTASALGDLFGLGATFMAPLPSIRFAPAASTRAAALAAHLRSGAATGAAYGATSGLVDGPADLTQGDVSGVGRDVLKGAAFGGGMGLAGAKFANDVGAFGSRNLISSQRYLDPELVAEKQANKEYSFQSVPVTIDGEKYEVVVDGHHRIAAALADGVEPEWEPAHHETQAFARDDPEGFLENNQNESPYYYLKTGKEVW
jgi:hypothetical protein